VMVLEVVDRKITYQLEVVQMQCCQVFNFEEQCSTSSRATVSLYLSLCHSFCAASKMCCENIAENLASFRPSGST
jgi:hypothetical protein